MRFWYRSSCVSKPEPRCSFVNTHFMMCMDGSFIPWWRHQMEAFSALLGICAGNSPVPGEFPAQRPVTRSFNVFFDLRLNKPLSKQSWGWWFETLSRPLSRHRNAIISYGNAKYSSFRLVSSTYKILYETIIIIRIMMFMITINESIWLDFQTERIFVLNHLIKWWWR